MIKRQSVKLFGYSFQRLFRAYFGAFVAQDTFGRVFAFAAVVTDLYVHRTDLFAFAAFDALAFVTFDA